MCANGITGLVKCMQAFIQAWNAACKNRTGPSKVVIPPGKYIAGEVVFQGPCTSGTVTVEVHGTITAVPDPSTYPNGDWFTFELVNGLVLKGGIFDAQGQAVWKYNDCKANPSCQHLPVVSNTPDLLLISILSPA